MIWFFIASSSTKNSLILKYVSSYQQVQLTSIVRIEFEFFLSAYGILRRPLMFYFTKNQVRVLFVNLLKKCELKKKISVPKNSSQLGKTAQLCVVCLKNPIWLRWVELVSKGVYSGQIGVSLRPNTVEPKTFSTVLFKV